jgi:hypothetical protein
MNRRAARAGLALAALLAALSLGGLLSPATYARETANWAAQAVGQDWVDLLLAVPWLAGSAAYAGRGSSPARLLLAGAFLYTAYEAVIYAFAVRFNALFLLYCGTLARPRARAWSSRWRWSLLPALGC